jgi:hypothetical protein
MANTTNGVTGSSGYFSFASAAYECVGSEDPIMCGIYKSASYGASFMLDKIANLVVRSLGSAAYHGSNVGLYAAKYLYDNAAFPLGREVLCETDAKIQQLAHVLGLSNPLFYEKVSYIYHLSADQLNALEQKITEFIAPNAFEKQKAFAAALGDTGSPADSAPGRFSAVHLIFPTLMSALMSKYSSEYAVKALSEIKFLLSLKPAVANIQVAGSGSVMHSTQIKRYEILPALRKIIINSGLAAGCGLVNYFLMEGMQNALINAGVTEEKAQNITRVLAVAAAAPSIVRLLSRYLLRRSPQQVMEQTAKNWDKQFLGEDPAQKPKSSAFKLPEVVWDPKKKAYIAETAGAA